MNAATTSMTAVKMHPAQTPRDTLTARAIQGTVVMADHVQV